MVIAYSTRCLTLMTFQASNQDGSTIHSEGHVALSSKWKDGTGREEGKGRERGA